MSKQEEIRDACSKGKIGKVRRLIKRTIFRKGVDVNSKNSYGDTPLLVAAIYGHFHIIELLIKHGANLNIQRNYDRMTPLMCAAEKGYFDIIKVLIENGAKINMVDNKGNTALYYTIESKNIRIFELLFSLGAYEGLYEKSKISLIIHIFYKNFIEGAKFILSKWEFLKNDNAFKEELISRTVEDGNFELTEMLIKYQTNVNTKDKDGRSILKIAVLKGHAKIVELLISNGVDINIQDTIEYTPLHWAIKTEKLEIAKLLINAGAELNTTNFEKETPLLTAWKKSLLEIIKLLINKGANGNIKVNSSDYMLNYALYFHKLEIAEILIENGADVNVKDDDGKFPLLISCLVWHKDHEESLKIFKLLISKGADLNSVTEDGKSILSYALEHYRDIEAKHLINNGANINFKDKTGKTPFDYAIKYSYDAEVIKLLLPKVENIFQQKDFDIFLKNAILESKIEIARLFIKMGANVKSVISTTFENGDTLLIAAACESKINVVEFLINIGANVNEKNEKNGDTPLHGTCRKTDDDIIKDILDDEIREANYDAIRREPIGSPSYYEELEKRYSYYHVDKKEKDKRLKIAEILILNGADMSIINNEGFTPLQLAQRNGHLKIIEFLK